MMERMIAYDWPGNIRELENILEQSAILNDGKSKLELKRSLPGETTELSRKVIKTLEDVKRIQEETEREYIIATLKKTEGRIRGANGAAELLNIKPTTLGIKNGQTANQAGRLYQSDRKLLVYSEKLEQPGHLLRFFRSVALYFFISSPIPYLPTYYFS